MFMRNERIKSLLQRWFKLRFAVLYPFGVWAILSGFSSDESIRASAGFILLGLIIRSWANFYAIKTEKLTTSGPYAYVRHPLYLGSFLIMIGFLIMLRVHWLVSLIFVAVVIGVVYRQKIREEEDLLLRRFGEAYRDYKSNVPALLPLRFSPYPEGEKWPPSFRRYIRSQEYKLVIWTIVLAIVFHLKDEFILEGERLEINTFLLLLIAFLLGMVDVASEFFRHRSKNFSDLSIG